MAGGGVGCADALVSDERAEAARAQAAEEAEAAFQRECTFTPALDTVSKKLAELSQPRYTHASAWLSCASISECR